MSVESFKILPAWGEVEGEFGYGSLSAAPKLLSELRSRASVAGLFFRSRGAGRWANNISIECRYIHAIKDATREWTSPLYIKPKDVDGYDSLVPTTSVQHPPQYGGSQDLRTVITNTTVTNPLYDAINNPNVPPTLSVKVARYTDDLKIIIKMPIPKTIAVSNQKVKVKLFESATNDSYMLRKDSTGFTLLRGQSVLGQITSGKLFRQNGIACILEFPSDITNTTITQISEYTEEYIVRRVIDKRWSDLNQAATSVPKRDIKIGTVTTSISNEIEELRTVINNSSHLVTMPRRQYRRNTTVDEIVNDMKYHSMTFALNDGLPSSTSYFKHDFYQTGRDDETLDYIDFCSTGKEEPVSYTGRINGRIAGQRSVDYPYLRTFDTVFLAGGDGFDNPALFKTRTETNASFDKNGKYALIVEMCHLNWVEKYNGAPQELGAICQSKDSNANDNFDSFKAILLNPYQKFNFDASLWSQRNLTDYQYLWKILFDSTNYPNTDRMKDDLLKFFWTNVHMSTYSKKAWAISSAPDCDKFPECTACMPPPDIIRSPIGS